MNNNSQTKNLGGNELKATSLKESEIFHSEKNSYHYEVRIIKPKQKYIINNLPSCTVYVSSKKKNIPIFLNNILHEVNDGDVFVFENLEIEFLSPNYELIFFIVGTFENKTFEKKQNYFKEKQIYKVTKPWGYELWLNGENPNFAFKKIIINPGYKTSLQYHKFKKETNVLYAGKANLYFKSTPTLNNKVTPKDIDHITLEAPSIVNVNPNVIHRIESLTKIILLEASTPHLEDVIRIADDTNRKDGKINEEHGLRS